MNISKILLVFVLALSIASCKKDDDGETPVYQLNNTNLAGTYSVTLFSTTEVEIQDVNGFTVETTTTNIGKTFDTLRFVFTESGEISGSGGYVNTFMRVVNGETNQGPLDAIVNIDETASGTFSSNNSLNTVTITFVEARLASVYNTTNYSESGITLKSEVEVTVNEIQTTTTQDMVLVKL